MAFLSTPRLSISAWLLFVFVVACLFMGGGSRADTASLILLRPLAALFLAAGLIRALPRWSEYRIVLGFAIAAIVLVAIQLVPLPPAIWMALPGRGPLIDVQRILGLAPSWHPLSMQPIRTWNALLSMTVPMAVLLLCLAAGRRAVQKLLPILVVLGALSALIGLLQTIGPDTGPLYFYNNTDGGFANGLFANRNHHAAFIACMFPMLAIAMRIPKANAPYANALRWILGAFGLFLIPLLLLTGSRAGLLLSGIGLTGAAWLYNAGARSQHMRRSPSKIRRHLPLLIIGAALTLVVIASIGLARAPSIDRLFGGGIDGGRRLIVYPTILRMIPMYFPVGSGFGTFAEIFQINEPDSILGPTYLNQAHNDWFQIIIEGGVPAALLAAAALVAVVNLSRRVLRRSAREGITPLLGRAGMLILIILGLASLVDYPIRTPSLTVLAVIALMWMLNAITPGSEAPQ